MNHALVSDVENGVASDVGSDMVKMNSDVVYSYLHFDVSLLIHHHYHFLLIKVVMWVIQIYVPQLLHLILF